LNAVSDLWNHPQLKARGRWVEVDSLVGPLPALKPAAPCDAFEVRMDAIPSLGQHTGGIRRKLGFGDEEIRAMRHAHLS
jgi:itaconate CoA-transferase